MKRATTNYNLLPRFTPASACWLVVLVFLDISFSVVHPHIRWGKNSASKWTTPELQLEEAISLVETLPTMNVAASKIVGTDYSTQRRVLWGAGRLEELLRIKKQVSASALMVNVDQLQPAQQSALLEVFGIPVFDRYNIVVSIFKQYAKTQEANLQVQLAEIPYIRHRLHYLLHSHQGHLASRMHVNTAHDGNGEDKFQVLKLREQWLRKKLKELDQADGREIAIETSAGSLVAVVGYTNAGKTSIVKRLTGSPSLTPLDRLFATLDTTRHAARLPSGRRVILTDTIGFLSDLPMHLLAAFEATLGHLKRANVIVHMRDVSHPDWKCQSEEVIATLRRIGVTEERIQRIIHIDKQDKAFLSDIPTSLPVSCKTGEGVEQLIKCIEEQVIKNTGCRLRRIALKLGSPGIQWLYNEGLVTVQPTSSEDERLIFNIFMTDDEMIRFQKHTGLKMRRS
ncbi:unnamed protein product, partial [Mesorhabditis spiculigera]